MILCDVGNTSFHFLENTLEFKRDCKGFDPSTISEEVHYINVNAHFEKKLEELENWIDLRQYIDFSKYYESMGIDRIVACEAIEDGVIIDAGSAITVDIVKKSNFEGGFIYPGLYSFSECYKQISTRLDYSFNFELDLDKMPKNSQDAISYGFLRTLYSEVIRHGEQIHLTGGDATAFAKIFADAKVDQLLIFKGMKNIIDRVKR
jgi:type III pantothenate kinase